VPYLLAIMFIFMFAAFWRNKVEYINMACHSVEPIYLQIIILTGVSPHGTVNLVLSLNQSLFLRLSIINCIF